MNSEFLFNYLTGENIKKQVIKWRAGLPFSIIALMWRKVFS